MKKLIVSLMLGLFSMQANANPSNAAVNACLRTESEPGAHYTAIEAGSFEIIEDEDTKKTATVLRHGNDTFGIWETIRPPAFGLVFNGKESSLKRVISLDESNAPTAFSPYEAMWGVVRSGKKSYICATFNFDGLGKSGRFQNVRGLYLIERNKHAKGPFYAVGNVASSTE